jgi:mannose-6-phosphate isomerase-like protein (cupin superfamily)
LKIIEKSWGHELLIHNGDYCCKELVYLKAITSSMHYHDKKHETFVVRSGMFSVYVENDAREWRTMGAGDWIVIPPKTTHRVRCLKPGVIVEASTHDDPEDCVRLIPSET